MEIGKKPGKRMTLPDTEHERIVEGGLRTKGFFKHNHSDAPLITVVTAVYNGERYIEQAIRSVLGQTYSNIEYIIIDGGSVDGTVDILKKYDDQIDYWVSEPDSGIFDAWNKALSICGGAWVAFLGCDDYYWNQDVIKKSVETLIDCRDTAYFVYGKMAQIVDEEVLEIFGTDWSVLRHDFLKLMNLPHPGAFHNVMLFEEYGYFNDEFKIAGDYELLLRALKNNAMGARFMPDVFLVAMRDGGISGSLSNRKTMVLETKRAREINGIKRISFPLLWWELRVDAMLIIEKLLGKRYTEHIADFYRKMKGKGPRWSK